jgi:hypothetical protein
MAGINGPRYGPKTSKVNGDGKMKIETYRRDMPRATTKLVDNLVKTNGEMAVTAIINAKKITVADPYRQEIINRAIAMGEGEIAKARDEMAKGRPSQAIRRLRIAWRHAQYAMFIGLEELSTNKTNEMGRGDMILQLKCFLSLPWIHFRRLIGLERKEDNKKSNGV